MRHKIKSKKFGRSSAHRKALIAALVGALIRERRIETTLPKAKACRAAAEKMVTLAKSGTLVARQRAVRFLRRRSLVRTLFADIAPGFKERQGGYCRIVKTGFRRGDASPMAILEWVGLDRVDRTKKEKKEEEKKKT